MLRAPATCEMPWSRPPIGRWPYIKMHFMVNLSLGKAPLASIFPLERHLQRGMKMAGINVTNSGTAASDRGNGKSIVKTGMKKGQDRKRAQLAERRDHRKQ